VSKWLQTSVCIAAALLICLVLATILIGANSTCSASCALANGRSVNVDCRGLWGVGMSNTKDMATINASVYTIVVGPKQVLVNGRSVAVLENEMKAIDVNVARGEIRFVADGKPLATWNR
jgi:hypothetical protein